MPLSLAIGAVAAPVVGGIAGNLLSSGDRSQALALQQQALNNLQNINTPEASQLALTLQKYQSAGQLSPQMESTISQSPSLLSNIQTDPRLLNASMQSMDTLAKIGNGALRPEDLAAMQQIKNSTNNQAQAQQQAILQNMAARGITGSGQELAARLSAGQNAANNANAQDLQIGSNASQRALQAINARATLGSQLQNQSFQQQAQQATAQDAINRYNAMNSQQVGNTNTTTQNAAQAQNLANLQNIYNANTGVTNQQATYNAQLPMQVYNAQLQKALGGMGQTNQVAGSYNQNAANTQNMYGGVGQGISQGLAGAASYGQQQTAQTNQNNFNQQYLDILKGNQKQSLGANTSNTGSTSNYFNQPYNYGDASGYGSS